jgi:hypothetical protein
MPINCKGINASRIHIPKSGIKYNQLIIVIRGEPINLVPPPKRFNKLELTDVKQVLLSLIHILSGKRIKWFTDNQNVVSIVSKGSTKTVLQELALDIFIACLKLPINLVRPPKRFNKFNYKIRYTTVVVITNSTKIISSVVL